MVDIREQFPLLPLNLSQKIAATLGVDHPTVPYSGEPNIMTTDFLLTCRQGEREFYRAISVKPEDGIDQRTAEKLDIESIWWELLGVEFLFFTGNEITKAQSSNIQWATSPFRSGIQTYTPSQVEAVLTVLEPGKHLLSDLCDNLVSIIQGRSEDGLNKPAEPKTFIADITRPQLPEFEMQLRELVGAVDLPARIRDLDLFQQAVEQEEPIESHRSKGGVCDDPLGELELN